MKAILNNEIIELNELSEQQVAMIEINQRTEYNGKWYFNPDNAVINEDAPPCPGEYYNFVDGEWILDETAAKGGAIAKLWQGATNYCESQINAAEYAKSLNLAGNSKAAENIAWYDAVWLDYYNRCALVESGDLDVSLDFSNNGSKPWKFWQVVGA